jgi:hypothetical protein
MIERAPSESAGRVGGPKGAAAKLGLPRQTVESKIRALGINKFPLQTSMTTTLICVVNGSVARISANL